jgi:hypothetical protein
MTNLGYRNARRKTELLSELSGRGKKSTSRTSRQKFRSSKRRRTLPITKTACCVDKSRGYRWNFANTESACPSTVLG